MAWDRLCWSGGQRRAIERRKQIQFGLGPIEQVCIAAKPNKMLMIVQYLLLLIYSALSIISELGVFLSAVLLVG
ncbi:hypothetical protein BpHYR1_004683 [Brachionus plicatilis]|uniref:Uncharacterized protein n=1 Tax=Brachionus plicatilis TaxID=10195 RepID=A0A3M7R3G1_BRAPC|nr:hypothetical protein BpHYR1_004683 [Brachionus plicatilis]